MSFVQLSLVFLMAQAVASYRTCPLLGPDFPLPTNLASSDRLQAAAQKFTATFEDGLAAGDGKNGHLNNATSYAIQFFSIDDEKPVYEYYYTSEAVKNSSFGVNEVTGDSIFRIGSISKLMTVYALLAELGDGVWTVPVTEAIPELRGLMEKSDRSPIQDVAWDSITLGGLAGQVAGLPLNVVSNGDIASLLEQANLDPTDFGLPELTSSELPVCQANATHLCSRDDFFQKAMETRNPTWAPNSLPAYSNTHFQVLGYAIESLTGTPMADILERAILNPLSLARTSYDVPDDPTHGVIPVDPWSSSWTARLGDLAPTGGMFASADDLSTVGRAILASTLLNANTTRAWLKPTTFTGSLSSAVGRPWEIYRQRGVGAPNRITDYYTKEGDIGMYRCNLALLPDYGVGAAIMTAGPSAGGAPDVVLGMLGEMLTPELEAIAREQGEALYGGTYAATSSVLNSSLVLSTDPEVPAFGIDRFISNGSEVLAGLAMVSGADPKDLIARLYPTNLEQTNADGTVDVSFRIVFDQDPGYAVPGPFDSCISWHAVDLLTYGQEAMDQLVFTVDRNEGQVLKVKSFALDLEMEKVE